MKLTPNNLQFLNYAITRIEYIKNENFVGVKGEEIKLNPSIRRRITEKDSCHFNVELDFVLNLESKRIPFDLNTTIIGEFQSKNGIKDELIERATNILFPYLRVFITTITSNAGSGAFILPILELEECFKSNS